LKSHAYIHSVQFSHHVFLNLHTLKFYCLPDNYEIIDSSLEDITYVLKPTFTKQQIANLDKQAKLSRAYDGTTYLPGIVGLNNIKANDYANAVLQVGSGWKLGEEVTWEHYEGESRNDSSGIVSGSWRHQVLRRTVLDTFFFFFLRVLFVY